jgi:hypothetical protein
MHPGCHQSYQIGLILAYWFFVYFRQFFLKITYKYFVAQIFGLRYPTS